MTAPPVVHYTNWFSYLGWPKAACFGICRSEDLQTTESPGEVTCKRCRRTKVWREAQK